MLKIAFLHVANKIHTKISPLRGEVHTYFATRNGHPPTRNGQSWQPYIESKSIDRQPFLSLTLQLPVKRNITIAKV